MLDFISVPDDYQFSTFHCKLIFGEAQPVPDPHIFGSCGTTA
jgi:hypothetical protein